MPEESSTGGTEPYSATPPSAPPPHRRRSTVILSVTGVLVAVVVAAAAVIAAVRPTSRQHSPTFQGPHYASTHDPCTMVSTASMTRFAPGDAVDTIGTHMPGLGAAGTEVLQALQVANCSWTLPLGGLVVQVSLYGSATGPVSAQQMFDSDVQGNSKSTELGGTPVTVTGVRAVTGLADQAKVIFATTEPGYMLSLLLWSGNAEIEVDYSSPYVPIGSTQLAGAIAVARNILTGLARPGSVSSTRPAAPAGLHFGNPPRPCQLITAATLAKYLPGATVDPQQPSFDAQLDLSSCSWSTPGVSANVLLDVTTYPSATGDGGAQQGFESDVQSDQGDVVTSQYPVTGLGDQAMAIFESKGSPQTVDLLVWSGNAEIALTYSSFSGGPGPAGELAAAIAMARDILAALPRS
jgi:hypothetical protein